MLEGSRRSAILAVNIARRARKDAARHGREGGFLVLDTPSQTWDSKFVTIVIISSPKNFSQKNLDRRSGFKSPIIICEFGERGPSAVYPSQTGFNLRRLIIIIL